MYNIYIYWTGSRYLDWIRYNRYSGCDWTASSRNGSKLFPL